MTSMIDELMMLHLGICVTAFGKERPWIYSQDYTNSQPLRVEDVTPIICRTSHWSEKRLYIRSTSKSKSRGPFEVIFSYMKSKFYEIELARPTVASFTQSLNTSKIFVRESFKRSARPIVRRKPHSTKRIWSERVRDRRDRGHPLVDKVFPPVSAPPIWAWWQPSEKSNTPMRVRKICSS